MTLQDQTQYEAIIFGFGVLFIWDPPKDAVISPGLLKSILSSPLWHDYEQGKLAEDDCYDLLATQFHMQTSDIACTFSQGRQSLVINPAVMSLLLEIRAAVPNIAVYTMSNIPKPHYTVLLRTHPEMSIFDQILPSGLHGARKPQLQFDQNVLGEIGMSAEQIIYIDDQLENVTSAQSIGMHGILYTQPSLLSQHVKSLMLDPVQRGMDYLRRHAKKLHSTTDTGQPIWENFSQLLILEATGDETLVSLEHHESTWNFFQGTPCFTTSTFPDDLDTTSLAWLTLPAPKTIIDPLLDRMTTLVNSDGIFTTYFTPSRPRTDPIVCTNILRLFHKYHRGTDPALQPTLTYIHNTLTHRTYLLGTRYYTSPESFLYPLSQLCQHPNPTLQPIRETLIERLRERINVKTDALSLAMRILACLDMGFSRNEVAREVEVLVGMQCEDGSWPGGCFCRYGGSQVGVWNRGVSTGVVGRAVRRYQRWGVDT
ncbi:uncharacterized protein BO80DRAFT_492232, partial [Aspergillus ibericus CBS 121593]